MGKRKGDTLEPGLVDVKETRHYRRPAGDTQAPIDGWLLTIGARQDLSHVAIYKYQRDGRGQAKYQLLPDRIEPPCDLDPGEIFRKWGDGDYRFSAVKTDHSFLTHKLESVTGFGAGERGGSGANSSGRAGADPLETTLTEMNNFLRQSIVSAQLRSMYRELTRDTSSGNGVAGGAPSAAEESALHAATFNTLLEQLVKMKTIVGGGGGGEITGQLVTKLVDKALTPPEPAEHSINTVSRLLEFADRLNARAGATGGELDLTSLAIVTILGIAAQSPELKAILGQLVGKYGPMLLEKIPGAGVRRAAAEAPPAPNPQPPPPAPAPVTAPGRGPEPPQVTVLRTLVYPMIRRAIELKSDDFETYERILENHLPGFLDTWSSMPLEDALSYVRDLDPEFLSTLPAREWMSGFYRFAKEPPDGERGRP